MKDILSFHLSIGAGGSTISMVGHAQVAGNLTKFAYNTYQSYKDDCIVFGIIYCNQTTFNKYYNDLD